MTGLIPDFPSEKTSSDGFSTWNCDEPAFPILLSVPHAGRIYPETTFDNLRIDPAHLVRLEDRYADRLAAVSVSAGIPTIIAHYARAWIDLNRDARDVDPGMIEGGFDQPLGSTKMRGGLGLIPRRLSHFGDIWKRPITRDDLDRRINSYHHPYHHMIETMLQRIQQRHGIALLVDLHSMPPLGHAGSGHPVIVIGDRFGQSASSVYAELIAALLRAEGFAVGLNHPYPGDYVLRRHGAKARNIHALQFEIDRQLYLDDELREPGAQAQGIADMLCGLIFRLVEEVQGGSRQKGMPIAAE